MREFVFCGLVSLSLASCATTQTASPAVQASPNKAIVKNPVPASAREIASSELNRLTCDDGLRIDEKPGLGTEIVLFGPAAQHFMQAGTYPADQTNAAGEYVRSVRSDREVLVAMLDDGSLNMPRPLNRANPNYTVTWTPYANGSVRGTNYEFHRCH